MSKELKLSKKMPNIEVSQTIHNTMKRLCNKSEDEEKFPNIPTYMDTFREVVVLAMALGAKEIGEPDLDLYDEEIKIKAVGKQAIHSQWETIMKAICYWWEYQSNPENTHEILVNPLKIKKISEGFINVGFEHLKLLAESNAFRIRYLDKIEKILSQND